MLCVVKSYERGGLHHTPSGTKNSLNKISDKFDVVSIENKFVSPKSGNGYADINVLVREKGNPNGIISEIQIHWNPLLEVKHQEDILYRKIRDVETSPIVRAGLEVESKSLYETFWIQHKDVAAKYPSIWKIFFK